MLPILNPSCYIFNVHVLYKKYTVNANIAKKIVLLLGLLLRNNSSIKKIILKKSPIKKIILN